MQTRGSQIDIECDILDVDAMADVCCILLESYLEEVRGTAAIASNSRLAEKHAAQWREPLAFAVTHLRGMTRALKKKHYADDAA